MQAVSARASAQRVTISRRAPGGRVAVAVVCQQGPPKPQPVNAAQKALSAAAATAVALPALLGAHPAFALVDQRMNGDGVGLPLGINNSSVGYVLLGVFSAVWIAWYNGQKSFGDDNGRSL